MILLVIAVAFFVIVGCVYYINVKSKSSVAVVSKDTFPICNGDYDPNHCIPEDKLQDVVDLLRPLDEILSKYIETYYCYIFEAPPDTKMPVDEAFHSLGKEIGMNVWDRRIYLLTLLIHNPHMAIACHGAHDAGFPKIAGDVQFLSLRDYSVSYLCLFKFYFIKIMLWKLSFVLLAAAIVYGIYRMVNQYFSSKVAAEEEVYELVDQIVRKLEDNQKANSDTPYLAVNHVRDMLIPLAQRQSRIPQWNKACNIIEEMESRVRIEFQMFSGEEYRVWRWLPKQESKSEASARCTNGRVWQGQAFEKNTAKYSPTPCLKIRNMFDSDVELGEDWLQSVQDSILEKCEEAAVLHIAIDRHSKEGTTYVKCSSPTDAGKLYNALHGWWFDGNLVTVKYLTLERYHERFPLSVSSTTPLTPSNDEKRSLQGPYHRSALEHT